jgi:hypothetical protein
VGEISWPVYSRRFIALPPCRQIFKRASSSSLEPTLPLLPLLLLYSLPQPPTFTYNSLSGMHLKDSGSLQFGLLTL